MNDVYMRCGPRHTGTFAVVRSSDGARPSQVDVQSMLFICGHCMPEHEKCFIIEFYTKPAQCGDALAALLRSATTGPVQSA